MNRVPFGAPAPRDIPGRQPGTVASIGLILLLLLATAVARAGTTNLNWHWSNPLPFGNNITALAYGGTNLPYVAACERGRLYSSTDLATWGLHVTGTRKALRAATYWNDRLIVTGESGLVLTGTDLDALTLLDLGTADWLEGVAASTTLAVAVGDNGSVYTSTNAITWVKRAPGFSNWLRGVAHGGSTPIFVTVGEGGLVATSTDGITWTTRNSGITSNLNRVTWTGVSFVAVGEGGVAIYSTDGIQRWRSGTTGVTGELSSLAVDDLHQAVAAGSAAVIVDATAGQGRVWKDELNPNRVSPPPSATYYSAAWDGSRFILGGRAGLLVEGVRSGFSYNWTPHASPTRSWLWDITTASAYGTNIAASLVNGSIALSTNRTTNTFYTAVGENAALLQSDSGIAWSAGLAPASASGVVYLGVCGLGEKLVAVGTGGAIAVSPVEYQPLVTTNLFTNGATVLSVVLTNQVNTLGIAWGSSTSKVTADLEGICITPSLYVATGAEGTILTSPDAVEWTKRNSPRSTFLSSVEAHPGGFVASGDLGTILSSSDGTTWANRSPNTTNWIFKVRYRGGQLVAVGQNGSIYTSPDGLAWTQRTSGVTTWLNDVTYVEGTWYVVGTQGVVLASNDTLAWTPVDSITGKTLYGVATKGGQLVAVGVEGAILRAQAGAFPSPIQFLEFPKQDTDHLFLFSGSADQPFRLDFSTNTVDWVAGPELEISDPQGVLLLLDNGTNNVPNQFFRAMPR